MNDGFIYIGIDDTDSLESRGTNKLAKSIALALSDRYSCRMIVRHQLLMDERIPFTSHNGSASIVLQRRHNLDTSEHLSEPELVALFEELMSLMLADFIPGSDPGLCLTTHVGPEVIAWGRRCQREVVTQTTAREIAANHGVRLAGLGGTEGGIIGALAAIGLAKTGHDGRLIRWNDEPDDLSGSVDIADLKARQIEVRCVDEARSDLLTGLALESFSDPAADLPGRLLATGSRVDLGKHARPNLRQGRAVLFVTKNSGETASQAEWLALRVK